MFGTPKELIINGIFWLIIFLGVAFGGHTIGGTIGNILFYGGLIFGLISVYRFIYDYSDQKEISKEQPPEAAEFPTSGEGSGLPPSKLQRARIIASFSEKPTNPEIRRNYIDIIRSDVQEHVKWANYSYQNVDSSLDENEKYKRILADRFLAPGDEQFLKLALDCPPISSKQELITWALYLETPHLEADLPTQEVFQEAIALELKSNGS